MQQGIKHLAQPCRVPLHIKRLLRQFGVRDKILTLQFPAPCLQHIPYQVSHIDGAYL